MGTALLVGKTAPDPVASADSAATLQCRFGFFPAATHDDRLRTLMAA